MRTGTFTPLPNLPKKLSNFGMAVISSTKLLIVGGINENGIGNTKSYIYDTIEKTYTEQTIPNWTNSENTDYSIQRGKASTKEYAKV
jgi:hypothetical protein